VASPCSSMAPTPKSLSGRFRRRLRIRSKLAAVLSVGLLLVLAATTASVWAFRRPSEEKGESNLQSSCVAAQNGTATCAHFEAVGEHLWDHSVGEFLAGSTDTQEDCCRTCDRLDGCQGWMFEHKAKSCHWIRFLEEPCSANPGDLSCRCVAHFDMTFGFKPTSQIIWVQREGA
jgi:hypothetical protein